MSTRAEELPTLDEPDAPPAPRPRRRIPRAAIAAAAVLAAIAAYRYLRPANGAGSILATRWSFLTGELKVTSIAWIGPET